MGPSPLPRAGPMALHTCLLYCIRSLRRAPGAGGEFSDPAWSLFSRMPSARARARGEPVGALRAPRRECSLGGETEILWSVEMREPSFVSVAQASLLLVGPVERFSPCACLGTKAPQFIRRRLLLTPWQVRVLVPHMQCLLVLEMK